MRPHWDGLVRCFEVLGDKEVEWGLMTNYGRFPAT
jgi:hypothetical protein